MVREHRARGIIFPDRSWHAALGPANASFRHGCVLNSDRTNLRRDHPYDDSTHPDHAVALPFRRNDKAVAQHRSTLKGEAWSVVETSLYVRLPGLNQRRILTHH